jgi:hypothetical protein
MATVQLGMPASGLTVAGEKVTGSAFLIKGQ